MSLSTKLFVIISLALPLAAQAQTTRTVSVGLSGGMSLPLGDLGDAVDAGYNATAHLYFMPSTTKFVLRGDVSYDSWKGKGAGNASLSSLGFTGNGIFYLGESTAAMRPYLLAGGGMYRTKSSVAGATTSTDPGIQGGLGLSFNLSGFNTFLEAKYVNVFGDGNSSNFVPISFGIRM